MTVLEEPLDTSTRTGLLSLASATPPGDRLRRFMLLKRDLGRQCLPFVVVQSKGFPECAKLGTTRVCIVLERVGHFSIREPILL